MKLAPSILTADLSRLGDEVRAAEAAGVDAIHLDVMDGHFVPNITIGSLVVTAIRHVTQLPLDVHLMIERPESYIAAFAEAGASSITVHQEACVHLQGVLTSIRAAGCRACAALNPATPIVTLEDVLSDLDQILIMTVNPGFGGQVFIPRSLEKVRRMRAMLDAAESSAELQVDGGVKEENIRLVAEAGATVAVVGSSVYTPARSVAEAVRLLRDALV